MAGTHTSIHLDIPEGVTEIKPFAYKDGLNLVTVTIPASVEKIGEYAFHGCKHLLNITVSPDNEHFCSDACNSLLSKDKTRLVRVPPCWDGEFDIPEGVTHIAPGALANNTVSKINIPDSVTEIGDFAFEDCRYLEEITIPASVSKIGKWIFKDCANLKAIYVDKNNPYYSDGGNGLLYTKDEDTLLYVPGDTETVILFDDAFTKIDKNAFRDCKNLKRIFCTDKQASMLRAATTVCSPVPTIIEMDGSELFE